MQEFSQLHVSRKITVKSTMASAPLKFFSFHSIPKLSVTQWKRHNSAINAYIFFKLLLRVIQ